MVDGETEMTNVAAAPATLIYNYRLVHMSSSDTSEAQLKTALQGQVTNAACTTPDTRDKFLNQGVTMRYSYYDKDRNYIGGFDVTRTDCTN